MRAGTCIGFLFGEADAICRVARSRAAFWTGIVLVLMTSIPRNYDQTLLFEKPFLWIFGPLMFSFVSGSWLYLVVYEGCARREMSAPGDPGPAVDGGWHSFMGLFWMTAPIAWLYAIPVERFMNPVSAAHANVALLTMVSLWRVVLMTRVLQVTTKAPFLKALVWVLLAASTEVLVVLFLEAIVGGSLQKSILASMAGMRNSPEEGIMNRAMNTAFNVSLWIAPLSFVVGLVWRPKQMLQPLPCPVAEPMRWAGLVAAACFWIAIAVIPQRELAKTVAVERLIAEGRTREAIDFMAAHQPDEFAPARPLPPRPFERSVFIELPACFGALQSSDPAWIRSMLMSKLDLMMSHIKPHGWRGEVAAPLRRDQEIEIIQVGLLRHGPDWEGLLKLLNGLQRFPEGRGWLKTNSVLTEAIWRSGNDPKFGAPRSSKAEAKQPADWLALSNHLHSHFLTNGTIVATNNSSARPAPPRR